MNPVFSHPDYFFNLYALGHFIVSGVILFLGVFVFLQNKKSPINLSYFLVCFNGFLWLFAEAIVMSSKTAEVALFWARMVYIGVGLLPPSMYFFSVAWLKQLQKRKYAIAFTYCLGAMFSILFFLTSEFIGVKRYYFGFFDELTGYLSDAFMVFFFAVSALFFWTLAKAYRLETIPIKKIQLRHVLIGFILCFLLGITEYFPTFGVELYPIGSTAVLVLAVAIARAIIRYRLMEIETVIHKTIAWFLTHTALVMPLAGLLYFTQPWYTRLPTAGMFIYLGSILLSFLFFVKMFQPQVDHFFQRARTDIENVLNQFSDELIHLKGLGELVNKITDTIINTLYPNDVIFLLYNDRAKKLVTVGGIHWAVKVPLQLDPEGSFLGWLTKNNRIINHDFVELDPRFEPIREQVEEYFQQLKAVLVIPLVLNEKLIGVINLGRKGNLKPYRALDYQFLNRLKNHATIALSNSLVYDRVEELVKIRTEELAQTQKQLIQTEKLATLGTLAGGVAHEINNPLTAILTNIQMMAMDARGDDEKESLSLMEEATKRCRTIVQKLMAYARQNPEKKRNEPVDLSAVVKNAVGLLQYQFQQDNIQLHAEADGISSPVVLGNSGELEQVLTNLLLNARDAVKTVSRQGEVLVSLIRNGAMLQLKVRDNGCGISPSVLPKIFDPFFTTKDVGKGTGLGLSICQSIIEQHHGKISVQSRVGEWTEFIVELPVPPSP